MIRLVFSYINKLKSREEPPQYIHAEKQAMSEIGFQFLQRPSALACAKGRSYALSNWNDTEGSLDCSIDEILFKSYAKREWRPDEITRFLNLMNP